MTTPVGPGHHFFLSYAPPTHHRGGHRAGPTPADLFRGLSAAVADRVQATPGTPVGFFDQLVPAGHDLKADVTRALSTAQTFVALYSPGYFHSPWSLRERAAFRQRIEESPEPRRHPGPRLVPVLWTPWLDDDHPEETAEQTARALLDGPPDPLYEENGLRALGSIATYRSSYEQIVDRLASRIVSASTEHPLDPSPAPDLDQLTAAGADGPHFVVALVGPPPHLSWSALDQAARRSAWWLPEPDGTGVPPVVAAVADRVERMGLVPDLLIRPERIVDERSRPGLMVIDPWVLADRGAQYLGDLLADLPRWWGALVLAPTPPPAPLSQPAPGRDDELASAVATMVKDVHDTVAHPVSSREGLAGILPTLVERLRRTYLRHAPVRLPGVVATRRPARLRDAAGHDAGHAPDAEGNTSDHA